MWLTRTQIFSSLDLFSQGCLWHVFEITYDLLSLSVILHRFAFSLSVVFKEFLKQGDLMSQHA